jgi:hypothetical protein
MRYLDQLESQLVAASRDLSVAASTPKPHELLRRLRALVRRHTRASAAIALCVVMTVPAATLAAPNIARFFGLSNQGVATTPPPCCLWSVSALRAAMRRGADETSPPEPGMRRLGTLSGFHFYAAVFVGDPQYLTPNSGRFGPRGHFCYGVASFATVHGVASYATVARGCVAPGFPSARKPVVVADPNNGTFVGFAADGIASVKLLDASGATLARATVHRNLFAADYRRVRGWVVLNLMASDPQALLHLTVDSLDAAGHVIARTPAARAHDWAMSWPGLPG